MRFVKLMSCLAIVLGCALPLKADVIYGESTGYSISVDLTLTPLTLSVPPQALATGTAPAPYADADAGFFLSESTPGIGDVSAMILAATATSDVDGGVGARTTSATGGLGIVGVDLAPLFGPPVLNLSATAITAAASVTGDFGALATSASSTLVDLAISVGGAGLIIPLNPAPNTVLFNFGGLTIVLNEQFTGGDGINDASSVVNAVHIIFNNVDFGGDLLNGDIYLASASALQQVPEPASLGLLALGAGVMLMRRRRIA